MWWITLAQAATVAEHRCTTSTYVSTAACKCLIEDPDGPTWWGGVGAPPDAVGTCFDVEAVLARDPGGAPIADTLLRRAQRIAHDRGYRLDPLLGLVSQEDKIQLSGRVTLVGWASPYELHVDDKPAAWLDTGGRVPWPDVTAADEDGDGVDDLVVSFGAGEVWVIVGPLLDGELLVLPDPGKG